MRIQNSVKMLALILVSGGIFGGCTQILPTQPIPFNLTQGLNQFDVVAGTPKEEARRVSFNRAEGVDITIGRGSLEVDPTAISFMPPAVPGKIQANLQGSTTTVTVTAWVGTVDELDTVFTSGDQYGPYVVTLGENNVGISVSPETADLTPKTVGLLNSGDFALGLRVESTDTGSVAIEKLVFNLGL